jgi:hypothetical protein
MIEAIGRVAGSGLLGCLLVILGYLYLKKDKQLAEQSDKNTSLIITLQREVIQAVTKLAEIVEIFERREVERDRERERFETRGRRA